jgi:L-rhamnose isomerase
VTLTDDLQAIAQEIVWGGYVNRIRIGLDYFDASINRVAAWVIGTRNMLKALLLALVAPIQKLRDAERQADYTTRLALMEDAKVLPFGPVWDFYCQKMGVPVGNAWLAEIQQYEKDVLSKRA